MLSELNPVKGGEPRVESGVTVAMPLESASGNSADESYVPTVNEIPRPLAELAICGWVWVKLST